MNSEQLRKTIETLIKKTKANNAAWDTTSGENQYILKLKNGALVLDKFISIDGSISWYEINFFDKEGSQIDKYETNAGDITFEFVDYLFNILEDKFNTKVIALKDLLNEIEVTPKLGKE